MDIVYRIIDLYINPAIFVLFGVALILFIWGLYKSWIVAGDGFEQRKAGAWHLMWGLVGMLIMGCTFAIMSFVKNSIDEATGDTSDGPQLDTVPIAN